MHRSAGACVCVSRGGGVLGDLLPRPIKGGFEFDSALKETDEPAKSAKQASQFLIPLLRLSTKLTVFFQTN